MKQRPRDTDGEQPLLIAGFVSAIVLLLLLQGIARLDFASQLVRIYGCIAIAFVVELLLYLWLERRNFSGRKGLPAGRGWFWGGALICLSFCMIIQWQLMPESEMWKLTSPALLLAFAVCLLLTQAPMIFRGTRASVLDRVALLTAAAITLVAYVTYCYVPNLLNASGYTLHHFTAVTQSIYNAAFSTPYTVRTTGMYGHYAIFFWPFLKLFGHEPQTVAMLMALCGAIAQILFILLLCRVVQSNILRILTIFAGTMLVATGTETYYQMWPLRYLWPQAVLLYLLCCLKKDKIGVRQFFAGYLLCCLATVWNTETGLVLTAAFTVGIWLIHWQKKAPASREMLAVYGKTLAGAAASIIGMVAIINGYNLMCGGPMIFQACFFPLLGGNGYVEGLETEMQGIDLPSLVPIFVFFFAVSLGLSATRWLSGNGQSPRRLMLGLVGTMGFAVSYYYYNRTIAGTGCTYSYFILCVAIVVEAAAPAVVRLADGTSFRKGLRCGAGVFAALLLCINSVEMIVVGTQTLADKQKRGFYSTESLESLAMQVSQYVPANTYAFGYITQEIYGILGWDPGYHQRDVSDVNYDPKSAREREDVTSLQIQADVNAQDALLIHEDQMSVISENLALVPEFGLPTSEPVLYYCTRNGQIPAAFDTSEIGRSSLPIFQTKSTGITREHNGYRFGVQHQTSLVLSGSEIQKSGLYLNITASSELFAQLSVDQFMLHLFVNDTELGALSVESLETAQNCELSIPAQQMPVPDENGMYQIRLECSADTELPEETVLYWLNYLGALKNG